MQLVPKKQLPPVYKLLLERKVQVPAACGNGVSMLAAYLREL